VRFPAWQQYNDLSNTSLTLQYPKQFLGHFSVKGAFTMTVLAFSEPALCRKMMFALRSAAAIAAVLSLSEAKPLHAQIPTTLLPVATAAPTAATAKMPLKVSIAARISTLGLGLEASALVTPNIAVRIGYNGYSYSHLETYQSVDYDSKLKLGSVPVLVDLYPSAHGGLHVTAGFLFNSNELTAHGRPSVNGDTQTFTLNGNPYNVSDVGSLNGRMTFSKTSPYLGIGFGRPAGSGSAVQFLFDLGVVFQGKPHLSLTRSGGTTDPTLTAAINSDLNVQQEKTQSDVNKFQYYPVVSFGLAYHF